MRKVGLTGGIGAGKSAVAARLAWHGAVVIDADLLAREAVRPGTPGLAAVTAAFGAEVLRPDGSLDRQVLGARVFADPVELARLNAIVHPLVAERTADLVAAATPGAVVVHDVPLLAENGLAPAYDLVIVVEATPEVRIRRLVESRGMPETAARARIAAQATDAQRRAVSDVVLCNTGSLAALHAAVDEVWREWLDPGRGDRGVATRPGPEPGGPPADCR